MEALIQTFHIDWKLIIAQLVNFGIVFLVLYKFALKPLQKIMTERTAVIEKGIDDAKNSAQTLKQAEAEVTAMITQARKERQEMLEKAKKDAEDKKNSMINEAKEEVAKIVTTAKNQLQQEKLKIIEDARSEVVELVTKGVEKVLTKSVDAGLDKKFVESIIKE